MPRRALLVDEAAKQDTAHGVWESRPPARTQCTGRAEGRVPATLPPHAAPGSRRTKRTSCSLPSWAPPMGRVAHWACSPCRPLRWPPGEHTVPPLFACGGIRRSRAAWRRPPRALGLKRRQNRPAAPQPPAAATHGEPFPGRAGAHAPLPRRSRGVRRTRAARRLALPRHFERIRKLGARTEAAADALKGRFSKAGFGHDTTRRAREGWGARGRELFFSAPQNPQNSLSTDGYLPRLKRR